MSNGYTKRTRVTVSHAIERAALAAAEDGPMVVVALFQRLPTSSGNGGCTSGSPPGPR